MEQNIKKTVVGFYAVDVFKFLVYILVDQKNILVDKLIDQMKNK